ncbi:uncharacterized protein LOC132725552 [Ruditapes philippinarum]|uniref:uncharacterized protein LOC132725552 n=1 Tax=Ruditapes philippinarum TaxID=129788 RepID=UPI00295A7FF2|nr:uncharacterized protein LOC132725552 [Ruditapes philippinarum]
MSLTDKGVKKGRLYSCIHCEKAGKSYREARYRVVGHILKHHLSLDQTPFYCSLCMFRCLTADALQKHVTGYKRHLLMAEGEQVNNSNFLVQNKLARPICEGTDYRQLSLREQFSSSTSAEDPLNRTDEFLLNDFDALDEQVQAEFQSSAVNRDIVNNSTSGQSFNQVGAQGLINVQVTPDVLAQLMQQKQVNQPQQAQTQVNQGNQMFVPPPPIQRQLQVPLAPHTLKRLVHF